MSLRIMRMIKGIGADDRETGASENKDDRIGRHSRLRKGDQWDTDFVSFAVRPIS